MKPVFLLNGPELDRLGEREPEIYGSRTLQEVEEMCRQKGAALGLEVVFRQTNDEEEMVGWIVQAGEAASGVIINPAILTHHSLRLRDALSELTVPVIEVHISNIYAREPWRAHSVVSGVARGVIAGLGVDGYPLALQAIAELLEE